MSISRRALFSPGAVTGQSALAAGHLAAGQPAAGELRMFFRDYR